MAENVVLQTPNIAETARRVARIGVGGETGVPATYGVEVILMGAVEGAALGGLIGAAIGLTSNAVKRDAVRGLVVGGVVGGALSGLGLLAGPR